MAWEDIIKEDLGVLKVGDWIETKRKYEGITRYSPKRPRGGIVSVINISMSKRDPAGELNTAVSVEEYDTSLDYQGAISFTWGGFGDKVNSEAWTYLYDIARIVSQGTPEFRELTEEGE